jgi:hypothetical protein
MPEASINDVGDSPGSLKLRDVACIRQNDQLRSLYGLVHAVGMLRGDQPITLAPDDGGGSFDLWEIAEHIGRLVALAILLARRLLGPPDDVVEDEAGQVRKVGARNASYRLAGFLPRLWLHRRDGCLAVESRAVEQEEVIYPLWVLGGVADRHRTAQGVADQRRSSPLRSSRGLAARTRLSTPGHR